MENWLGRATVQGAIYFMLPQIHLGIRESRDYIWERNVLFFGGGEEAGRGISQLLLPTSLH